MHYIIMFLLPYLWLLSSFGIELQNTIDAPIEDLAMSTRDTLDYKRRQEIYDNYMKTLAKSKETWVDPHNMFGSVAEYPNDKSIFSDIKGDIVGQKDSVPVEHDINNDSGEYLTKGRQQIGDLNSVYISRWLKAMILKLERVSEPSDVRFLLDSNALSSLKEFSVAKTLEITQLDEFICHMIEQSVVTGKPVFDWSALKMHILDFLRWVGIVAIMGASLYVVYQTFLRHPLLTAFVIIVVISIFWHWMHLYQQKLSHKHAELSSGKIPAQCRKRELGLFEHMQEYFRSYFITDECNKYYEALMVDPFYEVSFTMAAAEAVTAMVFQPLSAASRQVNYAVKQLFDGLSIFMTIVVLVFCLLFSIMMFNYRIKLPFFMGALEPSFPSRGSSVEDVHRSKSITLLKNVHKVMNQDKAHQHTDLPNTLMKPKICNVASRLPPLVNTTGAEHFSQSYSLQESCQTLEPTDENPPGNVTDDSDNESFQILDGESEHHCPLCCGTEYLQIGESEQDCPLCGGIKDLHTDDKACENFNQNPHSAKDLQTLQLKNTDGDIQTHDSAS